MPEPAGPRGGGQRSDRPDAGATPAGPPSRGTGPAAQSGSPGGRGTGAAAGPRARRVNAEVAHPDLLGVVAGRLAAVGVPSPRADARWLVEHVAERGLDPAVGEGAARLDALVARREAREPLQLVLGTAAFRTVEVACRPGVFIPRPETEVVAGVAIDAARAAGPAPVVVEPCTGTGAIACSLLAEVPGVRVIATDLDPTATALARENLARVAAEVGAAGAADEVDEAGAMSGAGRSRAGAGGGGGATPEATWEVLDGDLLAPVDPRLRGHLDVLVSNPPYLPSGDRGRWEPEVADHDPDAALVGGPDGHEVVEALLVAAATWLAPGGLVVLEIDERRGAAALATAERVGLVEARLVTDLTGAERAIAARRRV
jgi:release factor glutamine methyltransferase